MMRPAAWKALDAIRQCSSRLPFNPALCAKPRRKPPVLGQRRAPRAMAAMQATGLDGGRLPFTMVKPVTTHTFPAQLRHLPEAVGFLSARAAACGLSADRVGAVELVAEELLVNIINYAYPEGGGEVTVGCQNDEAGRVVMTFVDGGPPFDPLALPPPNIGDDIDARTVGGLGVFIVRHLSEDVSYSRCGDANHLTITFEQPDA